MITLATTTTTKAIGDVKLNEGITAADVIDVTLLRHHLTDLTTINQREVMMTDGVTTLMTETAKIKDVTTTKDVVLADGNLCKV